MPLFDDVISKYDIVASTHIVAIAFLILHGECNLALQMVSTEKLETRAVIICQQQGGTPSKTLKEKSAATHRKHAVSGTVFFDGTNVIEKEPQASTTSKGEGERRKLHRL